MWTVWLWTTVLKLVPLFKKMGWFYWLLPAGGIVAYIVFATLGV